MKSEQIYQALKKLAVQLHVEVSEQNFRITGVKVKSGFCLVKNEKYCYIDKHLRIHRKIDALAGCLAQMPYDNIYVVPAILDLLERYAEKDKKEHQGEITTPGESLDPE